MTGKIRCIGFAFLAALLSLTSCRDLALDPVFYTLSQEIPLGDNRGFPDESAVFRMVKITVAAVDYYLVAANTMYIRGVGISDTWTVVAPPTGLSNALCNTLEVLGTQIYAGFYNSSDATGYGLYTASLAALPLAWTAVGDTDVQNVEITLLKNVGGQLFVATNTSTNANTLYYGNGAAFTAVGWTTPPPVDIAFIDVAQATSGGSYWILVGAYLYQSAALPGGFAVYTSADPLRPISPLSGLPPASGGLFDDSTALYVSAGNGFLYSTVDGGANWTRNATAFLDDNEDFTTRFTSFVAPAVDNSPLGTVYVGTQGQGYYRIPGGDVAGGTALTREPSYNITALYTGALNCLFYDSAASPQRLFLCTNGSGLWRGEYAGGSTWTWKQE